MNHKKHTLEIGMGRMRKLHGKRPHASYGQYSFYIFVIEETRDFLLIGNHPINCTFHAI